MSGYNYGEEGGGGLGKPYVIIKGGFNRSLRSLTKRGRGVQNSKKLPYVIYEQALKLIVQWFRGKVTFKNPLLLLGQNLEQLLVHQSPVILPFPLFCVGSDFPSLVAKKIQQNCQK